MDAEKLAQDIVKYVGGNQNIKQVIHCVTRLRLDLYEDSQAQMTRIKELPDVLSVVSFVGQYQIIINTAVPSVYAYVSKCIGLDEQ